MRDNIEQLSRELRTKGELELAKKLGDVLAQEDQEPQEEMELLESDMKVSIGFAKDLITMLEKELNLYKGYDKRAKEYLREWIDNVYITMKDLTKH